MDIYLASGLTQGRAELETTEDITVKKMSFFEAECLVKNNIIFDSFSITPLYKYKLYKENKL